MKYLTICVFVLFSFLAAWVISEQTKAPEDTLTQLYEANSKP
jgi:hypothetical protein